MLPPGVIGEFENRVGAIAPVGEQGFLTPVRASAGDATYWHFVCRCGTKVIRKAKDVRKVVREGRTPKCSPKCDGKPATPAEASP
jgi:hypothetical protein